MLIELYGKMLTDTLTDMLHVGARLVHYLIGIL